MGLSDEERIEKMHWSCYHISETARNIKQCKPEMGVNKDVEQLISFTDQIWPFMVGMNSNGLHWIIGSSSTSQIKYADSLWATAIMGHCSEERDKYNIFNNMKEEFNPLDYFLSIEGLLNNCRFNGKLYSLIYKLYACTEDLAYSLRRYDDDLSKRYKDLSNLIANIQGMCFTMFAKHNEFARAYLASEIFNKLYANNFFKSHAMTDHWHHHLSLIMNDRDVTFSQVMDWHRVLHKENKLKDQDFILIGLEIMGRRYHYDHSFNGLKKAFNESGIETIPKKIERQFKANQKLHTKKELDDRNQYSDDSNYDHMFAIHGFDYNNSEKDIKEKRNKQKLEYQEFQKSK